MNARTGFIAALATMLATGLTLIATVAAAQTDSVHSDPRLRDVTFNPHGVVTVPVKRGVVTLIALSAREAITQVASGLGGDCAQAQAAWCIAAQAGGHDIFVKPKTTARASNNLEVVTDRRTYSFRLVVLPDADARAPVYRLVVEPPTSPGGNGARLSRSEAAASAAASASAILMAGITPSPSDLIAERLTAAPRVVNADYSIAEGKDSEDIVPTLVFDDGRFTYFRFPGNRDVPAVFNVLGDGSESVVNSRMEGDLLVVDRVSRRLMLRAGSAVVGVWNEAFDLNGQPPVNGTTVPGVQRVIKSADENQTGATTPSGAVGGVRP